MSSHFEATSSLTALYRGRLVEGSPAVSPIAFRTAHDRIGVAPSACTSIRLRGAQLRRLVIARAWERHARHLMTFSFRRGFLALGRASLIDDCLPPGKDGEHLGYHRVFLLLDCLTTCRDLLERWPYSEHLRLWRAVISGCQGVYNTIERQSAHLGDFNLISTGSSSPL
jgi:hypothetical protein